MTAEQYYDNISVEFKYPFALCVNDFYTVEIIRNDEKWVVNVENLIRSEKQLEFRPYYTMPHSYGESGIGEIPHWEWVKDLLKIVCTF